MMTLNAQPSFGPFPSEIYDHIISFLSPSATSPVTPQQQIENRSTLWTCTRVSRAFCKIAYSHLVASLVAEVTLSRDRGLRHALLQTNRLADMLSAGSQFTCTLQRFIKKFSLVVDSPDERGARLLQKFLQDTSLATVISGLHGHGHGIESIVFGVACDAYLNIDRALLGALATLLRSQNLRHVRIDGVKRIPTNLFQDTKIKHVELYNYTFYCQALETPHTIDAETFSFDEFVSVSRTETDASPIDLPGELDHFECSIGSSKAIITMIKLVATKAVSLSKLHIKLTGQGFFATAPPTPPTTPDRQHSVTNPVYHFSLLPQLRSLRISKLLGGYHGLNKPGVVQPIARVLELSTLPQYLHELILDTTTHRAWDTSTATQEHFPLPEEWAKLDELLSQEPFSSLAQITIVIRYHICVEAGAPTFDAARFEARTIELVERVLPRFCASRVTFRRNVRVDTKIQDLLLESRNGDSSYRGGGMVMRWGGKNGLCW